MIDRIAQNNLYNALAPFLFGICKRYLPNEDDASDALQISFIKIFENYHTLENSKAIKNWAKRITVNTALNILRDKKMEFISIDSTFEPISLDDDGVESRIQIVDHQPNPEEQYNHQELLDMLHALPNGYKTAFNLFFIEGYTHHEIANMLNVSVNTSKSQVLKAKRKLQQIYDSKYKLQAV